MFEKFNFDPSCVGENRLAPRAHFVPYGTAEAAMKKGLSDRVTILNGEWDFRYFESPLDLPENVRCITADCGYSDQKEIIAKIAGEMKFPPKLVMPLLRLGARLYGGFDLYDETPLEAVKRAKVPIFFAHGEKDGFVPCKMCYELYDACASDKVLFIAKGAAHGLSFIEKKKEYCDLLKVFFTKHGAIDMEKDNF